MIAPGLPAAIAAENCDQVNSAPARVSTSRKAVLLTVPFRLIVPAPPCTRVPEPRSRKVLSFSAGLPLRIMALSSCVGGCRERGGWPPAWEHTRDGDARRRLQGMPAADPAGRAGLVRKGGLEPPRLAALEPKSRASTNSATFALRHCSDGPSGAPIDAASQ